MIGESAYTQYARECRAGYGGIVKWKGMSKDDTDSKRNPTIFNPSAQKIQQKNKK